MWQGEFRSVLKRNTKRVFQTLVDALERNRQSTQYKRKIPLSKTSHLFVDTRVVVVAAKVAVAVVEFVVAVVVGKDVVEAVAAKASKEEGLETEARVLRESLRSLLFWEALRVASCVAS